MRRGESSEMPWALERLAAWKAPQVSTKREFRSRTWRELFVLFRWSDERKERGNKKAKRLVAVVPGFPPGGRKGEGRQGWWRSGEMVVSEQFRNSALKWRKKGIFTIALVLTCKRSESVVGEWWVLNKWERGQKTHCSLSFTASRNLIKDDTPILHETLVMRYHVLWFTQ